MAGKIFINYRRDDSAPHALNVAQYLENTFGKRNIFIDIDRLRAGLKFRTVLEDKLGQCKVMLAIIGPNWIDARDGKTGSRRIDNPEDWVRVEIERALARNIPVIPILLDGARMPKASQLPKDLKELSKRGGIHISDASFYEDMVKLMRGLEGALGVRRGDPYPQPIGYPFPVNPRLHEVHVGASSPPVVSPGETFVARFAAYTDANRDKVKAVIEQEAPTSQLRLDLDYSRWRRGAEVAVRLECEHATVSNPVQTFSWDGSYKILRFDVTVADNVKGDTLILRFDVAVEGIPIISLRPEIKIKRKRQYGMASFVEMRAPRSAFASYAASDRREVAGRIRSLMISTQIDVFFDRQSILPGEKWKEILRDEIGSRDIFWLFWSRKAMKSRWVDWEWRTALAEKTIDGIQPHPLEPSDLAPAPEELSALQFGAMYEWYIHHLQSQRRYRRCRRSRNSKKTGRHVGGCV
jgi:hypothetical protein